MANTYQTQQLMHDTTILTANAPCPERPVFDYAQRREKLRKRLWELNLDAMLVFHPANRFYLSGFELHDGQPDETSGCLVICADGKDWLATDARYEQAAKDLWEQEYIFIYTAPIAKAIARLLSRCGACIGVELNSITCSFRNQLDKWGAPPLLPVDGIIEDMRMIKDEEEIRALHASFALNHSLLDWFQQQLPDFAAKNFSEQALAWEIEKYFRQNGARELAFSTIAAIGRNAALPHAIPGTKTLRDNEPLLIDIGCRVYDYCSDQTRTWWIGSEPSREFGATLELVKKAQQAAMQVMRPGVLCCDVYAAARKVFEDAGQASNFTHGLGHGVGLQTHEAPSLNSKNRQPLQKGMAITVEPGLYYPPWGGVRWENTVLIVENGMTIL